MQATRIPKRPHCPKAAAVAGTNNEELAAAAGRPLLGFAAPIPLRALRSSRDSMQPGRTDRFFEREVFGDIAIEDSSDPGTPVVCVCVCVRVDLESLEVGPDSYIIACNQTSPNITNGRRRTRT